SEPTPDTPTPTPNTSESPTPTPDHSPTSSETGTKPGSSTESSSEPGSAGSSKKSGISSGAIAGIVVAVVVAALASAVGLLFWRRHRQKSGYAKKLDYAEFPEYNPSAASHPAYASGNVAATSAPSTSAVASAYQPRYPPNTQDPNLLRELDEA
ncbi:hypothetical protein IWW51_005328, partial [Coemansia sp. RSA 2702]